MMQPRPYQSESLKFISDKPRNSDLSDPGVGKTFLAVEQHRERHDAGKLAALIVVAPDAVAPNWRETFEDVWGDRVVWHDCRSGRKDAAELERRLRGAEFLAHDPQCLHVYATTADWLRARLSVKKDPKSRDMPRVDWELVGRLAACRLGGIFDECHQYTRPESTRGRAVRALSSRMSTVSALTGTPIGGDTQLRAWGHTGLVAPGVLLRAGVAKVEDFRVKYCVCTDVNGRVVSGGPIVRSVDDEAIMRDLFAPQRSYTIRVSREEALPDLPPIVMHKRFCRMPDAANRMHKQMREELRVVDGDALLSLAKNKGVSRGRVLEIANGWLEGRVVHDAKLRILADTLAEFGDAARCCSIWANRSRTLLSAALVAAGVAPGEAMAQVAAIPPAESLDDWEADDDDGGRGAVKTSCPEYRGVITRAWAGGVGIMHGPTPSKRRELILDAWKRGDIGRVAIHPGVGGAGLNLQFCRFSIYVEQCRGSIERTQSLARHHRSGVAGQVDVVDLLTEGSLEPYILRAHNAERDEELEVMAWLAGR